MSRNPFDPSFDQLPPTIPVFPLTGVLLLPRGRLPLNIFEPRYLSMTRDALAGDRMIGMVQPATGSNGSAPSLYTIGCAGRITSFAETEDGRFLLTLTGVARFDIVEELTAAAGGYRRVTADWSRFAADLVEERATVLDRERFLAGLRLYFSRHGISANWDAIEQTPDERLVTSLAMICPFEPGEKQALLEADTLAQRADLLLALIEIGVHEPDGGSMEGPRH